MMKGSSCAKVFEKELTLWHKFVLGTISVIETQLKVQGTWISLENVFKSEDIKKQIPTLGEEFRLIDIEQKKIMAHMENDRHVKEFMKYPDLLPKLKNMDEKLDVINKGLNEYLEKKRLSFPRFYFLSNEDLIYILSDTRNPLNIQRHISKCFEGVAKLQFTSDKKIIGTVSAEGEKIPLESSVDPAELKQVEVWLAALEAEISLALRMTC